MSGFSIELEAHLNLSNIEAELKSINSKPITLSNFQVDTGGIAQKIQQGLNGQAFSINLSNANMSRMTGQLKTAGTHMGNQLSNSINSSLNKLNVSSKNVSTISGMLAGAGLDPKSIAKVTRGLDGMAVSVGKITTKEFGNGNVRMMIDGVDELGRAVQITRDFNKETGDVLNTSTKFSQKFGENMAASNKQFNNLLNTAKRAAKEGDLKNSIGAMQKRFEAIGSLGGQKTAGAYRGIQELRQLAGAISNPRSSPDQVVSAYERFGSVLNTTGNEMNALTRDNSAFLAQQAKAAAESNKGTKSVVADYKKARTAARSGDIDKSIKELDASRGALSHLGADKLSSLDASIARAKELQGVLSGPNMSAKNMATAYRDFGEAVASARNQVKSLNIENAEAIKQQGAKVKAEQSAVASAKELLSKQGQFAADESRYQNDFGKIKGTGHSLIGEIIKDHDALIAAQNGMRDSLVKGDDAGLSQWYSRYTGISQKIKNEMATAMNETSDMRKQMAKQAKADEKMLATASKYGKEIDNGKLGSKIAEATNSMNAIAGIDYNATSKMSAWVSQMRELSTSLTAPGASSNVSSYVKNYEQFQSLASKVANLKSETLNANAVAMNAASIKKDFIDNNKLAAQIQSARTTLNGLAGTGDFRLGDIAQNLQKVEGLYSQITSGGLSSQEIVNKFGEIKSGLESVTNSMHMVKDAYKNVVNPEDVSKFGNRMDEWMNSNTRAAKKYASELSNIQSVRDKLLRGEGDISDLKRAEADFAKVQHDAAVKGLTGKSLASRMKDSFLGVLGRVASASIMYQGMQAVKSMYDNVLKVDTAMTELKKVTNETDYAYDRFLSGSEKEAQRLGTTVDGLVNSTADFARLGYGFKDSQYLAKAANIYAVVGDEVGGVDNATKSIISTMAAFGVKADDSMSIVDKFNEVGNNFAISSGGIGEALKRSASSLAAANNDLDQSVALVTAANTVVQNPDTIGGHKECADVKNSYIGQ